MINKSIDVDTVPSNIVKVGFFSTITAGLQEVLGVDRVAVLRIAIVKFKGLRV